MLNCNVVGFQLSQLEFNSDWIFNLGSKCGHAGGGISIWGPKCGHAEGGFNLSLELN